MASLRVRTRADGTTAYGVLYIANGRRTSVTFNDENSAREFMAAANSIGPERAMRAWDIAPTPVLAAPPTGPTVREWVTKYIESRTGVTKATIYDYNSYLKHDIAPTLGDIPLSILTRDDVAQWVQMLSERKARRKDTTLSGKTLANRHGFLSAALNAAVKAELIPSNPAEGTRLPRTERKEMVFLTHDEFDILLEAMTDRWRPLLRFMVASGARIGEVSALKPANVDRRHNTVFIGSARKRTYDKSVHEVGATKTKRSERLISVDGSVLDELDYSGEWLFTNTVGKPIMKDSFRNNVWYPACARAKAAGLTKRPRIHDMRHTCASWMLSGGASMFAVQKHLGHESISTTINLYSHLDRKDADAAAAIIGNMLRRPSG